MYYCIKLCLIVNIFNIKYNSQMLSVFIIGLGCYAEYMRSNFTEQEHFLVTPSIFLLVIGSLMLVFSFPGFVGALRDNTFMLKIVSCVVVIFTLCFNNVVKIFYRAIFGFFEFMVSIYDTINVYIYV